MTVVLTASNIILPIWKIIPKLVLPSRCWGNLVIQFLERGPKSSTNKYLVRGKGKNEFLAYLFIKCNTPWFIAWNIVGKQKIWVNGN